MFNLFADIIPYDPNRDRRIIEIPEEVVKDTIDTVQGISQQVGDGVSSGGGHSLPYIIGALLAAVVGLGFLIFMIRSYRKRTEMQVNYSRT